jgi:hypothetical protein
MPASQKATTKLGKLTQTAAARKPLDCNGEPGVEHGNLIGHVLPVERGLSHGLRENFTFFSTPASSICGREDPLEMD